MLGWRPGEALVSWVDGDRLILRSREAVERELWEVCAPAQGLADELIADRRRESALEAQGA
jgi:hypothetical protein